METVISLTTITDETDKGQMHFGDDATLRAISCFISLEYPPLKREDIEDGLYHHEPIYLGRKKFYTSTGYRDWLISSDSDSKTADNEEEDNEEKDNEEEGNEEEEEDNEEKDNEEEGNEEEEEDNEEKDNEEEGNEEKEDDNEVYSDLDPYVFLKWAFKEHRRLEDISWDEKPPLFSGTRLRQRIKSLDSQGEVTLFHIFYR